MMPLPGMMPFTPRGMMPFHSAGVDAHRFAVSVLLSRRSACLGLFFRVIGGSVPLLCLRHSSEGREPHGNRRARTNRIRIAPQQH